jgi:hypothetical protein
VKAPQRFLCEKRCGAKVDKDFIQVQDKKTCNLVQRYLICKKNNMKNPLICACLLITFGAMAQKPATKFGFKTGINFSFLSTAINSEPKMKSGFHFGTYMKSSLSETFFFRPEIYFSRQGQIEDHQTAKGVSVGASETTLNYLNVPLLFEDGKKLAIQVGPQIGFLLSGRQKGTINNVAIDDNLKEVMKAVDLSLIVGIGVSPGEHFNAGIRVNWGLTDIYKGDDEMNVPGIIFPTIKNRVIHFYIAFSL